MSDQLLNKYWESLSQNSLVLWSLFQGQHKQLQQLKELNTFLQSQVTDKGDDITNIALAMALAVAQAIATNPQASISIQTLHDLVQSTKATDLDIQQESGPK